MGFGIEPKFTKVKSNFLNNIVSETFSSVFEFRFLLRVLSHYEVKLCSG